MKIIPDPIAKEILIPIALTATRSKIQIKNRSSSNEYGIPVAAASMPLKDTNYVEWMIGYDTKWGSKSGKRITNKKELAKLNDSTLENIQFMGANGYIKAFYELSEFIYYFYQWGIIKPADLASIKTFLESLSDINLIDQNSELAINRSQPTQKTINGIAFNYTQVKYPLLIHQFPDEFDILTEIKITEKQRAVGIQPMLYLCFPVSKIITKTPLVGRTAKSKETGYFKIDSSNINVFVHLLKIFGMLSKAHRQDILSIINKILIP